MAWNGSLWDVITYPGLLLCQHLCSRYGMAYIACRLDGNASYECDTGALYPDSIQPLRTVSGFSTLSLPHTNCLDMGSRAREVDVGAGEPTPAATPRGIDSRENYTTYLKPVPYAASHEALAMWAHSVIGWLIYTSGWVRNCFCPASSAWGGHRRAARYSGKGR